MALRSSRQSTRQALSKLELGSPPQAGEMTGNGPNGFSVGYPLSKLTQADQDDADKAKQRESVQTLVQTWLDSLQLISVITTFFVATEASWLVITIPSDSTDLSTLGQLANIGIMGALIVHGHAAIIAFLAAFCLIRHKLTVAEKEEEKIEENLVDSPKPIHLTRADLERARGPRPSPFADDLRPRRVGVNSTLSGEQIIWSTNPHLIQVGPFQTQPPTELLARCHFLCVFLTSIGFVLALAGMVLFTWDRLPRSIGIFTSIATLLCVVSFTLILIVPSTKTSHIYYKSTKSH